MTPPEPVLPTMRSSSRPQRGKAHRAFRMVLRSLRREAALRNAFRKFKRSPQSCLDPDSRVLGDLIYGWGNETWSASPEYLHACIQEALVTENAVLECGSGLTSLVVGVIADQRGLAFLSLEHNPDWAEKVRRAAKRLRIRNVSIHQAPLTDYDGYTWYSVPAQVSQYSFSLVLCDGPPANTPGGRYGLVPNTRSVLRDRCVILLDDAARPGEQAVVQQWLAEAPLECEELGTPKPYFRLVLGS